MIDRKSDAKSEPRSPGLREATKEVRRLRKALQRLSDVTTLYIASVDQLLMAKPTAKQCYEQMANLQNALDWENDWALHFGLGVPLEKCGPNALAAARRRTGKATAAEGANAPLNRAAMQLAAGSHTQGGPDGD